MVSGVKGFIMLDVCFVGECVACIECWTCVSWSWIVVHGVVNRMGSWDCIYICYCHLGWAIYHGICNVLYGLLLFCG